MQEVKRMNRTGKERWKTGEGGEEWKNLLIDFDRNLRAAITASLVPDQRSRWSFQASDFFFLSVGKWNLRVTSPAGKWKV